MMRIKLETVSNICVTVASLTLVAVLAAGWTRGASTVQSPPRPELSYVEGRPSPRLSGLATGMGRPTLLLFVRSTCKYCTESLPFYARLTDGSMSASRADVIAVTQESVEQCRAYLTQGGVAIAKVVSASGGEAHVRGTPTLVLLDGEGVVRKVWEGKLSPEAEAEVLRALQKS